MFFFNPKVHKFFPKIIELILWKINKTILILKILNTLITSYFIYLKIFNK